MHIQIFLLLTLWILSAVYVDAHLHPSSSMSLHAPILRIPSLSSSKNIMKELIADLPFMAQRLPTAVTETIKSSAKSFSSSVCVLIPIGLMINAGLMRTPKEWLIKGALTGTDWAKVSAVYAGGEIFLEKLRGKSDRHNAYIGSGLSSALLRMKEGPTGVMKGFVMGYAFMVAVDNLIGHDIPHHAIPSADTFHHHCVHAAHEASHVMKNFVKTKH